jgi:hypothetical protein
VKIEKHQYQLHGPFLLVPVHVFILPVDVDGWAHLSLFRALHQNSLHGPIPAEIKNCTELRAM